MNKLNSKRLNAMCYFSLAALGLYLSAYQNVLPDITSEYSFDGFASGLIVSVHFIASFLFPFLIGPISDKKGRKPVLVLCFLLILLSLFLVIISNNVYLFILSIFIIGGSYSVIEGSMSSLLSEVNPGQEGKVMNISQMYFCAGAVVGPILGMVINSIYDNWRSIYVFVILVFVLCLSFLIFSKLPNAAEKCDKNEASIGKIIRNKYFIILLAAMFLYISIEEGTAFWIGEFVDKTMSGAISSSLYLSVYWLGMALGRLCASIYKGSASRFSSIMLALSVVFFGFLLLSASPASVLIGFFFVGFGFAPVWPLIMTLSTTSFPDMPDTSAGGVMSAGSVGAAISPMILGACTEMFSIKGAFILLLAFLISLFFVQLFLVRKRRS